MVFSDALIGALVCRSPTARAEGEPASAGGDHHELLCGQWASRSHRKQRQVEVIRRPVGPPADDTCAAASRVHVELPVGHRCSTSTNRSTSPVFGWTVRRTTLF